VASRRLLFGLIIFVPSAWWGSGYSGSTSRNAPHAAKGTKQKGNYSSNGHSSAIPSLAAEPRSLPSALECI